MLKPKSVMVLITGMFSLVTAAGTGDIPADRVNPYCKAVQPVLSGALGYN